MTDLTGCAFCEIVAGRKSAKVLCVWSDAMAFLPLGPVTEGHALVVPRLHVRDAQEDPLVTGMTFARAAQLAGDAGKNFSFNLITSSGADATQSVFHLHVHLVPRRENDGLALPWGAKR